ncbi:MAG: Stage V sporulation protein E [Parcubacteria group bacterium GW2011_GWE2_39_37]|uniref:Probable peptidoglycan glycosyltransferase FtsW n=1 Tax=Candidatus Falkowbacteria bacterium GW2011_GWF2_39_8 TaxID=1618642 RepID=A0A0G0PTF0_9BACT|nr:MAG: Stage V sporulation protein E [Parcubacteria group bacterium GW2011_GWE2_39_37]KKR31173.1 MAG: Stage V sporulation protein E [Candidatus Falkowbacteria bacterium GW2011_GWF2_39_8]
MAQFKQKFNKLIGRNGEPDIAMLVTVSIIILLGLIMLSSASGTFAYSRFNDGYYFIKHQFLALLIGIGLFFYFSKTDYHIWKKYSIHLLIFSVVLLILVFIPGISSSANFKAQSWINIFGFSLQPSEFVKLTFLIYLAAWLEARNKKLESVSQGVGPFLAVLGVIAFLMLMQPDFGTLSIIVITSLIAYFVGGGKVSHIFMIILAGIIALFIMVQLKPYQAERFRCFMDPSYNSAGTCYQVNQSLIAVGSGGLWGRGFGASRQKLMYLPEVSGDSIFPVIGEEMGFVFSSLLVILFLILFYRGYIIAKNSPDHFGQVLAIGIVSWITIQAIINIGGMINLMPMTGVPLPFISSGGSAIMSALAAVGILANISRQAKY